VAILTVTLNNQLTVIVMKLQLAQLAVALKNKPLLQLQLLPLSLVEMMPVEQ